MSLDDRMRNLFPFHSFSAQKAPAPLCGRGLCNAIKLATPISNGGLFGTPPGFCTDTCLWQV